jgi:predicted transposase YbfD/YdcC
MEPLQSTLLAKLAQVPDIRCPRGQRFAWSYLLAILTAGLAAGQTTILDLVDWAQQHTDELIAQLQPKCPRIPSAATFRRVLQAADALQVERQVAEHNQALDAADQTAGSVRALNGQVLRGQAVDGKDVRGVRAHANPHFLVSLVRHQSAYVLGQAVVDAKTNEITAVPLLLAGRDLSGTLTTMDALLTQEAVAQQILAQHGHYLMIVKKNQLNLYRAIETLFQSPPVPARPGELLTYTYAGPKAHGRLEQRTLDSSIALNTYLTWPGLAQVLRRTCRRVIVSTGLIEAETTYGITSVPRELGGPKLIERFWRGHWTIENRLHYVRDETMGEDSCQVYTGTAPQVLATLRNGILTLLRYHGWSNIAAANRHYAASPQKALQLLGGFTL